MKTLCRICHSPVPDSLKRFDACLGSVCPECREFSAYADTVLRRAGVVGHEIAPERYSPNTEPQ